ncbi:hypothetical protein A1O3_09877 [Capronia epimyces CBS 606.96]|uniref:Zn(2)-C6 fungal-type domain-containing protein n=1 Tax=Capronia epimyces CBS 606.96 TaxID=1182542 RepID=W9Y5B5_9EURO|nr:uncharacterized protein A1O3_09877 [Capronia epimyces CBS 606.96]EXJ77649.1 hypothetical protein A1O3_09877 [Capronia epimyces CBS 606.96]
MHQPQAQSRPVRPLAPAATPAVSNQASATSNPSRNLAGTSSAQPVSATTSNATIRKNASIACHACKISKRKCDRNQPCGNCSANNRSCIYDALQDGRRKEVRKRRLEELEARSQALDKLLVTLKHSSRSESRQLLDLIRRDAPLEEILQFLDDHPGQASNEAREALSASPPPEEGAGIRRMLAISELTDIPPYTAPAAPWTKITEDDSFVSHLISCYFTWFHFYYHNFDENLFLEAMKAGDLGSPFCSPFLVNVVLAIGCLFSVHPAAFATPGDPKTLGLQFYTEAHRLWALEGARPTLTNIQGTAFIGKDRASAASLKQLEVMAPQLMKHYGNPRNAELISQEFKKSLSIVDWATHIYTTGFGTGLLTAPSLPKPTLEAPYTSEKWNSHLTPWTGYPLHGERIQLPLHKLYHYMCELYLFASDIQTLLFADFPSMGVVERFEASQRIEAQMQQWYSSLPSQFRVGQPDLVVVPQTVDLAFTMYHFSLFMWNWTIPPPSAARQHATASDVEAEVTSEGKEPTAQQMDEIRRKCKDMCFELTANTTQLYQTWYDKFPQTYFSMLMPQTGSVAASFLLSGNLKSAHEEDMLLQIMRVLVRSSPRWQMVKGITQMLLKTAEEKSKAADKEEGGVSKALVEEMKEIVKDLGWEDTDHLNFSSQYPNYAIVREDPSANVEMSQLLEKWAELAIDEKEVEATSEQGDMSEQGDIVAEDRSQGDEGQPGERDVQRPETTQAKGKEKARYWN